MYVMSKGLNSTFNISRLTQESISDLIIPNDYFNGGVTSFVLSNNADLKRIAIGNYTFENVRLFELNGLSELESVVIGEESFTYATAQNDMESSERGDGIYRVMNCPKLASIRIGNYSFSDYHSFELANLPSLQSIEIDQYVFYWVSTFSLISFID